jgi:hypothetical protein
MTRFRCGVPARVEAARFIGLVALSTASWAKTSASEAAPNEAFRGQPSAAQARDEGIDDWLATSGPYEAMSGIRLRC